MKPLTQIESSPSIKQGLRRRIAEYSLPLTATRTADKLDKEVDTILVGYFLNPLSVGYYVVAKQPVDFIQMPINALGFTIAPTFGAQKAGGEITQAARLYETTFINILLLYIPAGAGLILVADPFIELVFGTQYRDAVPVLQTLGV